MGRNLVERAKAKKERKDTIKAARTDRSASRKGLREARKVYRGVKRDIKKAGRKGELNDEATYSLYSKKNEAAKDQIKSNRLKLRAAKNDVERNRSVAGTVLTGAITGAANKFLRGQNRSDKLKEKAAELDAKTYKRGGKLRGRKYVYGGVLAPSYVYASAPVTAKVVAKRKAMPTLRSSAVSSGVGLAARRPASTSTRSRRRCSGGSLRTRRK